LKTGCRPADFLRNFTQKLFFNLFGFVSFACLSPRVFTAPMTTSATARRPPAARRAKPKRERRWLQKPESQTHFRGPENRQRAKAWRKAHPGYWRKGKPQAKRPLQHLCRGQSPQAESLTKEIVPAALQDLFLMQPAVVVGFIATLTGSALQEDIAEAVRRLRRKGAGHVGHKRDREALASAK
jgi:hypothetical protein